MKLFSANTSNSSLSNVNHGKWKMSLYHQIGLLCCDNINCVFLMHTAYSIYTYILMCVQKTDAKTAFICRWSLIHLCTHMCIDDFSNISMFFCMRVSAYVCRYVRICTYNDWQAHICTYFDVKYIHILICFCTLNIT